MVVVNKHSSRPTASTPLPAPQHVCFMGYLPTAAVDDAELSSIHSSSTAVYVVYHSNCFRIGDMTSLYV